MSYTLDDLKPFIEPIEIGNKKLQLGLLTLSKLQELTELIGDVNLIGLEIKTNPLILFDVIWLLLENKYEFDTKKDFTNFIYANAKTSEVSLLLTQKMNEALIKSNPKIKNAKKYNELMQIHQQNNDFKLCYGVYYDRLAKRYGYSITDFFNLTMGQLYILLNVSSEQSYTEIETQAALQGRKLKERMKFDHELEENNDKQMDDDAQEMLKRLQENYKNNKG